LGLDSHKKENKNQGTAPLFMLCLIERNITAKATSSLNLLFTRIVQIHRQGTKRRMRFLWPFRFLPEWRGKNRENFFWVEEKETNLSQICQKCRFHLENIGNFAAN